MKDSEFIELLNLYLDHEISAADAARLEAEVQGNPARRRIYEDYCRMQKACQVLAQDFKTDQPVVAASRVIDFNAAGRQPRASFYTIGAAAAAAACVAIIFVGQNRRNAAFAESAPAAPVATTVASPSVEKPVAAAASLPAPQQPVAGELSLARDAQALLVASVEQANQQFEWMRNFQLTPLPQPANDSLRLEVRPVFGTEPKTYRSRQPVDANVEMTAWRFQR